MLVSTQKKIKILLLSTSFIEQRWLNFNLSQEKLFPRHLDFFSNIVICKIQFNGLYLTDHSTIPFH